MDAIGTLGQIVAGSRRTAPSIVVGQIKGGKGILVGNEPYRALYAGDMEKTVDKPVHCVVGGGKCVAWSER